MLKFERIVNTSKSEVPDNLPPVIMVGEIGGSGPSRNNRYTVGEGNFWGTTVVGSQSGKNLNLKKCL